MIKVLLPREAKSKGFITLTALMPHISSSDDEYDNYDGLYYDKTYVLTIPIADIMSIGVVDSFHIVTSDNTMVNINTEDNRIYVTSIYIKNQGEINTLVDYGTLYNAIYSETEINLTSN